MIKKLYKASQAGVEIKMIVRGICCIVPQIKGYSENIEVISIVDRFLEHARVFIFHHAGEDRTYLSSADWMVRNLSYRVETAFPVYDPQHKKTIREQINIQLEDNVKARVIDLDFHNETNKSGSDLPVQSQKETYFTIKRQLEITKTEKPAQQQFP